VSDDVLYSASTILGWHSNPLIPLSSPSLSPAEEALLSLHGTHKVLSPLHVPPPPAHFSSLTSIRSRSGSYLANRKISIVFAEIPEPVKPAPAPAPKFVPKFPPPPPPPPPPKASLTAFASGPVKRKTSSADASSSFDPKRGRFFGN